MNATVTSAVGNKNFGKELVSGLKGAVINSVGATAAGEIGLGVHDGSIDDVGQKVLHTGLGGVIGYATTGEQLKPANPKRSIEK